MNDVALEILLVVEPLGVKRNQRPLAVYSERIHGNWGVEDVPQGTLALKGPGSGGISMELGQDTYHRHLLRQVVLRRPPNFGILLLDVLLPSSYFAFVVVNRSNIVPNLADDSLESIPEGLGAKVDTIVTRDSAISFFTVVGVIGKLAGRESDVASCKEEDPIALAVFIKVETTSAFEVRESTRSDWDTESGSKWAAYVSC